VRSTLIAKGLRALEEEHFANCKFLLVPDFYTPFGDGAGVSVIHPRSSADVVRKVAKAVCGEIGLEWFDGENNIEDD